MSPSPSIRAFKVYDIPSQQFVIARHPCRCGAAWRRVGGQRLVQLDGRPCDEVDATCDGCGATVTFQFDVSGFFGHEEALARWIATTLPAADERTRGRLVSKVGPPLMTRITSFIQSLASDGDVATLAYLQHCIQHARDTAPTSDFQGRGSNAGE